MKNLPIIALLLFAGFHSFSQNIQKSWIVTDIENLTTTPATKADFKYFRYEFADDDVYISSYPGWSAPPFKWKMYNSKFVKIGFETYEIEMLTDSTFVFAKDGFRRFKLISEKKFSQPHPKPDTSQTYKGNTVYKADNYFTPRLKKQYVITDIIKMADYQIKTEMIFLAKFVVTTNGKVDRIVIVQSINAGFDKEFKEHLMETSGKWTPAILNNKPVNSELTYTIHYIKSPFGNY